MVRIAFKSRMAGHKTSQQQIEHLLFGSVSEEELKPLLDRLRGLCDYATTGGVAFTDREIAYKIEAGSAISKVRVRQSMDSPEAPWHLIYSGQLEVGDAFRPTAVRNCVLAACSHNLMDCLNELGFTVMYELILKGWLFKKGQMKVAVFKLFQPTDMGDLETASTVSSRYLVELSALTLSGHDSIGNEMKMFAEQLKPTVVMERTDGIR